MYLMIFEDGTKWVQNSIDKEDIMTCDEGYLEIIDISANPPTTFYKGQWHELEMRK